MRASVPRRLHRRACVDAKATWGANAHHPSPPCALRPVPRNNQQVFENLILNALDVSALGVDLLDPSVDLEAFFD